MKSIRFFGRSMSILLSLLSTAYADIACDNLTANLLDIGTMQLLVKQVIVANASYDADADFQGMINGKYVWKLKAVRQSSILPTDCQAQAQLAGNGVVLTKIITSNNRVSYSANFEINVLNGDYFLVLKDYAVASSFVGKLDNVQGLVGFHIDTPDTTDSKVRVYVCDGNPSGKGGYALWFTGSVGDGATGLAAAGATDKITYQVTGSVVTGTVTFADGRKSTFTAPVETNGSGIYDITVSDSGFFDGSSSRGDVLNASVSKDANGYFRFTGTVTPLFGVTISVTGTKVTKDPFVVDSFTAVALVRNGILEMAGRSGAIRKGQPGLNVIDGTSNTLM